MSHPTLRRYLTLGAFAAILTVAGTAPANARGLCGLGSAGRAWHWLQDVWKQGASALWNGPGAGDSGTRGGPYRAKEGPGVDPNGAPQSNSAHPLCGTCTDQGYGVDPDG